MRIGARARGGIEKQMAKNCSQNEQLKQLNDCEAFPIRDPQDQHISGGGDNSP